MSPSEKTSSETQLPNPSNTQPKLIVCLGRSCRKYNSQKVFNNFQRDIPPDIELISVPCLGQCGSGPMVLVESDQTWYSQVHPDEVNAVIERHLNGKSPVKEMLYPKFHKK